MNAVETKALEDLNEQIGKYEDAGKWEALRDLLATQDLRTGGTVPLLAFRRANGACVDARSFLDAVAKGGPRTTTDVKPIHVGKHVLVVRCVVSMNNNKYDNVRVFVRADGDADWKLLAWANEQAAG